MRSLHTPCPSPSPSCSRTTARCRTIRRCRRWSTRRAIDLRQQRDPERDDRENVHSQRLGPRPVAQRHLSVRALSLDDPRGARHRARPRARAARRRTAAKTFELAAGDVAVLPAGTGHQRLSGSDDLLVIGAYPPDGTYNLCRGDNPAERDKALTTIPKVPVPDERSGAWARTDRCRTLCVRAKTACDKKRMRLDQFLRLQALGDLRECASPRRALPRHRRRHPRLCALAATRTCSTMAAAKRPRPI